MTKEDLFERLKFPLPGETAHMEFSPMRGKSSEIIQKYPNYRESAVAIILYIKQDELFTLITERQTYNGQHSGQMSFPGGKKEDFDFDLLATATRECFEEIGLFLSDSDFQIDLTPVFIPVSNFKVYPKVFYLEELNELNPSSREVAEIYEINLHKLFHPSAIILKDIELDTNITLKRIPHFSQDSVHIWGATALMLNELKILLRLQ